MSNDKPETFYDFPLTVKFDVTVDDNKSEVSNVTITALEMKPLKEEEGYYLRCDCLADRVTTHVFPKLEVEGELEDATEIMECDKCGATWVQGAERIKEMYRLANDDVLVIYLGGSMPLINYEKVEKAR